MRKLGRIRAGNESGISLVEIMVALALASGVLMALALATIGGVKGTLLSRQNQLAGDMVNQGLERVRALDFADVSMVSTDPSISTDPRISLGKFDPGTGTAEGLIYAPVGTLNPHKTTETHNSQSYDVWRYVTQPSGLAAGTRRLTVVVTWSSQGRTHERQASTFVTATRRGLPLPRFLLAFSSPSSQSKGVGTTVSYGLRLKNYGARDAWNITSAAGTWSYVVDTNKNGLLDATETTALTDSDADGVLDTGPVEVNSEVFVVASETVAGPVGATYSYSWTFRSIAQPAAAQAAQTVTGSLTVTGAPTPLPTPTPTPSVTPTPSQSPWPLPVASCATTCTLPLSYLHELPVGSHANSGSNTTTFDTNATLQPAVYDFSVGAAGSAGRFVGKGGVLATETNRNLVADWRQQANAKINVQAGQAVAYLYIACLSGSGPMTVNMAIGDGSSTALSSFTSRGTGTATLTTCNGTFKPLAIPITIASGFAVTKNKYLALRAVVPATMTSDIRIGYDWASAASTVVIPE